MKRILLLASVLIMLFVASCSDSDKTSKSCEAQNTGDLTFVNSHEDPYDVYVNGGVVFTMSAYSTNSRDGVGAGNVSLRFIQKSGYFFYPTEITYTVSLQACENKTVSF